MDNSFKGKKAKVTAAFKQKVAEQPQSDSDNAETETYFIEKIQVYLEDFELERAEYIKKAEQLEEELEEAREAQLRNLKQMQQLKNTIKELEAKAMIYKNRLKEESKR